MHVPPPLQFVVCEQLARDSIVGVVVVESVNVIDDFIVSVGALFFLLFAAVIASLHLESSQHDRCRRGRRGCICQRGNRRRVRRRRRSLCCCDRAVDIDVAVVVLAVIPRLYVKR